MTRSGGRTNDLLDFVVDEEEAGILGCGSDDGC